MKYIFLPLLILFAFACKTELPQKDYASLQELFKDWRAFEVPPLRNNAPDYTKATFSKRMKDFEILKKRLIHFDTTGWQVAQINDWKIIYAEMNGFDFNHRILKPWERDPAFYKLLWTERSDVPAHEGPTPHYTTELWQYDFPLNAMERKKFIEHINRIPPFSEQAKLNLTGNAKDLWIAGIRDINGQAVDLKSVLDLPGVSSDQSLVSAIKAAIASTNDLEKWLIAETSKKMAHLVLEKIIIPGI